VKIDPGILLVACALTPAVAGVRNVQEGAASRPASAPAVGAPVPSPVTKAPETAAYFEPVASAPASRPAEEATKTASAPATEHAVEEQKPAAAAPPEIVTGDARLDAVLRKIEELRALERKLESGERVSLDTLEKNHKKPPIDAEVRTRRTHEDVVKKEEQWAQAREERESALSAAYVKAAQEMRVGPLVPDGPLPHPLAKRNEFGLGLVLFQRGKFAEAAERFALCEGARARYFEARALDASDQVFEAMEAYKKAAKEAAGDEALLASIERARKALDWKTKLGKPEDLTAALRPANVLPADPAQLGAEKSAENAPTEQKSGAPVEPKKEGGHE